ncbi:MAG: DUF6270 domain-containing protein [Phenylobacterium sp.]
MARVGVIGSCITRDLWPVRGDSLQDVLYVSRTSFPSLVSPPTSGFRPAGAPPGGLRAQPHRALVADLQKTALARLVAFRPTHLIFDFIDERFDLLSVRGTVATHSWELETSGYLEQKAFRAARPISRLSPGCSQLWEEAAREITAFVGATPLREAVPILHSARWGTQSRGPRGRRRPLDHVEILPGRTAAIAAHNALLERYEAWFMALMPSLIRVEAPDLRLADEGHQWGLSPFHYVPAYYRSIWGQLATLGLDPPSRRSAAPSAPAA